MTISSAVSIPQTLVVPAGKTYTYSFSLVLGKTVAKNITDFTLMITPASKPEYRKTYSLHYVSTL